MNKSSQKYVAERQLIPKYVSHATNVSLNYLANEIICYASNNGVIELVWVYIFSESPHILIVIMIMALILSY